MSDAIVITGAGVIGAGAQGKEAFARSLVGPPPAPELEEPGPRPLAMRRVPPPQTSVAPREARRLTRPALFAIAAASEALAPLGNGGAAGTAIALGTGYGSVEATRLSLDAICDRADLLSPAQFVASVRNEAQSALARILGLRGPAITASARRLSFEDALGWALVQIGRGRVRSAVVVGTDEVTPLLARILIRYRLVGERTIPGEGAGAILIERESAARDAGRRTLARLGAWTTGTGSTDDEALAIDRAIARAGIDRASVELFLDEGEGSLRRHRERERLLAALRARGIRPTQERAVAEHSGYFPSAGALVAVAGTLAVSGALAAEGPRAALVSAREADGSFAAYVLERFP